MKIVDSLGSNFDYPILSSPLYLKSGNDVEQIGYFLDGLKYLSFTIRKKYIFRWIQFSDVVHGCTTNKEQISFLNEVVMYVKRNLNVCFIQSINTAVFEHYPTDSFYCKFGTYIANLTLSEDDLIQKLHSKHRNVIKKAISNNVTVSHGFQYAEETLTLINETFKRQSKITALNKNFIINTKSLGKNIDFWIAKSSDGKVQGSAIFLWKEGDSCYYLYGGSTENTTSGSMNLLIWEAMKEMKSRGVLNFDFVGARLTTDKGSKIEGIQRFKSRFGTEMKIGYMFRIITNKMLYLIYKILFIIVVLLKEHSIPQDVITIERSKGNF